jgi:glycosyltransferase involved in cell wall biosynthesis
VAGDAALFADPYDVRDIAGAMGRLMADASLRDELGASGRQRARSFTWAEAARATLEVYDECLACA